MKIKSTIFTSLANPVKKRKLLTNTGSAMPIIFDRVELPLLPALKALLMVTGRADFCVGYFNLCGWRHLAGYDLVHFSLKV